MKFHKNKSGYDGTCARCNGRAQVLAKVPQSGRRPATKKRSGGYVGVARWGISEKMRPMFDLMSDKGRRRYVPEHRLVMAVHLGRPLTDHEVVHHRDGVRTNNRKKNLRLFKRGDHHPGYGDFYQEWQEALSEIARLKATHRSEPPS